MFVGTAYFWVYIKVAIVFKVLLFSLSIVKQKTLFDDKESEKKMKIICLYIALNLLMYPPDNTIWTAVICTYEVALYSVSLVLLSRSALRASSSGLFVLIGSGFSRF